MYSKRSFKSFTNRPEQSEARACQRANTIQNNPQELNHINTTASNLSISSERDVTNNNNEENITTRSTPLRTDRNQFVKMHPQKERANVGRFQMTRDKQIPPPK